VTPAHCATPFRMQAVLHSQYRPGRVHGVSDDAETNNFASENAPSRCDHPEEVDIFKGIEVLLPPDMTSVLQLPSFPCYEGRLLPTAEYALVLTLAQ
jgi:hypothetical protein